MLALKRLIEINHVALYGAVFLREVFGNKAVTACDGCEAVG